MEPALYLPHYDMQFKGYESYFSCNIFAIWTYIRHQYWIPVEQMTRKIVKKLPVCNTLLVVYIYKKN